MYINIPAAPAAAAFPPDDPCASCVRLKVLELKPDVVDGTVEGGTADGMRPGCGRLGGTAGTNDAGTAFSSFLALAMAEAVGGTTLGSSGKSFATLTGTPVSGLLEAGVEEPLQGHIIRWPMKFEPA